MKKLLIVFLVFGAVTSCLPKKNSDVEPELAGTYQLTSVRINGAEQVKGSVTSKMVVTKPTDTTLNFTFTLGTNTANIGQADIKKTTGKEYDIIDGGTRIGSIDGTNLTLDFDDGSSFYLIVGKK